MYGLLTEGPALDLLRADPARLEAALEEATRLDPAVNFVFCVARRDVGLGDQTVKAEPTPRNHWSRPAGRREWTCLARTVGKGQG